MLTLRIHICYNQYDYNDRNICTWANEKRFLYKKSKRSRKPSVASKLKQYSDCIAGGSKCRNGSEEKNESIEYPEIKIFVKINYNVSRSASAK